MNTEEKWLLNEKWHGEKTYGFFADIKRLEAGEPLAYIIGYIPFLNTKMYLEHSSEEHGARPLIPRPETEFWVEKIIDKIKSEYPHFRGRTPKMRILDLCAGSGCIGVAIAQGIPESRVDFVEIDPGLHPLIQKNCIENGIDASRARIVGGNLFEQIEDLYDVIVSNPPYIDPIHNRTESSVKDYEPHIALFAEDKGFALIERIVRDAHQHLTLHGLLVIEHEPEHVDRLNALATELDFNATSYPDQYGVMRYTELTRTPFRNDDDMQS